MYPLYIFCENADIINKLYPFYRIDQIRITLHMRSTTHYPFHAKLKFRSSTRSQSDVPNFDLLFKTEHATMHTIAYVIGINNLVVLQ